MRPGAGCHPDRCIDLGHCETPDGHGEFTYLADPKPLSTDTGELEQSGPRMHGTPKAPMPPMVEGPNPQEGQEVPANITKRDLKKTATGQAWLLAIVTVKHPLDRNGVQRMLCFHFAR